MKPFKYSAVIRATSRSAFISKVIISLYQQMVLPEEIIIVIPYEDELGLNEINKLNIPIKIVKSKRGMVHQRNKGMQMALYDILLLDADVYLSDPYVSYILLLPISKGYADCVIAFINFYIRKNIIGRITEFIFGLKILKKEPGLLVNSGGGILVPKLPLDRPYYPSWIGPGLAIAIKREFAINNNIKCDEIFENEEQYAFLEDAALVMKVVNSKGKVLMTDRAKIIHLDESGLSKKNLGYEKILLIKARNYFYFWKYYVLVREQTYLNKLFSMMAFGRLIIGLFVSEILIVFYQSIKMKKYKNIIMSPLALAKIVFIVFKKVIN